MAENRRGRKRVMLLGMLAMLLAAGCSDGKSPEPAAPCDQRCQDAVALRALREAMKLAFNAAVQGEDAGAQDRTVFCEPAAGEVRVSGTATSNPQGSTRVELTYAFSSCLARRIEAQPESNYDLWLTGTVTQVGQIAAASNATMALTIATAAFGADGGADGGASTLSLVGTVYDPPIAYDHRGCDLFAVQNGDNVTGSICGRPAGFTF